MFLIFVRIASQAIVTNTQNIWFIKNCSKVSNIDALDRSISSFFITATSI